MEKVRDLAKKERGLVGLMAVQVFDVLREPSEQRLHKIAPHFSQTSQVMVVVISIFTMYWPTSVASCGWM